MAPILPNGPARQEDTVRRTPSHRPALSMRLGATDLPDDIDVSVVLEVMRRHNLTRQEFARRAGASRTQVTQALDAMPNRNLRFLWVLRQGADFVTDVFDEIERRMGLTARAKRAVKAELLGELVKRFFEAGERSDDRGVALG